MREPARITSSDAAGVALSRLAYPFVVLAALYHIILLVMVLHHDPGRITAMDRLHPVAIRKDTYGEDTYCHYQAGRNLLDGHSMYSVDGVKPVVPKVVKFAYHPMMGVAFAGVNLLMSPQAAHRAVIALEEVLLIGSGLLLVWHLRLRHAHAAMLFGMLIGFSPLYPEYYLGQLNVMVGFFLVAVIVADARGHPMLSAVLWAISIVLKSSLAVLWPLYLRQWRWRRLIVVGVFAVATGAGYFLLHPGSFGSAKGFFSHGMARNTSDSLGFYAFVLDLALRIGLPGLPAIHLARNIAWAMAGAAVVVLLFDRQPDASFWACVLTITYCLCVQHSWEQSYTILPPALCILAFARGDRRAILVWLLLAIPTPFAPLRSFDVAYVRPYSAIAQGFRWDVLLFGATQHASKALPLAIYWVLLLRERIPHLGVPWKASHV